MNKVPVTHCSPKSSLCCPFFFPTERFYNLSLTRLFQLSLLLLRLSMFPPSVRPHVSVSLISSPRPVSSCSSLIQFTDFFGWIFFTVSFTFSFMVENVSWHWPQHSPNTTFKSRFMQTLFFHLLLSISITFYLSLHLPPSHYFCPITCPWSLSRNRARPNSPLLRLMEQRLGAMDGWL